MTVAGHSWQHEVPDGLISAGVAASATAMQGDGTLPLQRVYGVARATKEGLELWEQQQAEIEKRSHRRIGAVQKLFMTHDVSPGAPFFLPHGTRIINTLKDFLRAEYTRYTPTTL